ncbi:MAG TPA: antitoxin family protein [Blastocatellia bacterium]|jgi:predicted DNA-binding antitoxin AbrB/MazE fold protein
MSHKITAIYENGILRPLAPLELPDNSRVEIEVRRVDAPTTTIHREQVRLALVDGGLSLRTPFTSSRDHTAISAERREELAHLFSADRPLSELIDEDREGR